MKKILLLTAAIFALQIGIPAFNLTLAISRAQESPDPEPKPAPKPAPKPKPDTE
jgi:hypothetical protein